MMEAPSLPRSGSPGSMSNRGHAGRAWARSFVHNGRSPSPAHAGGLWLL